jgi:uncharacterized repeat protein (TIGR04042 family)
MPELHFSIRWPDGTRDACYSPSTILRDHFTPATAYPMPDFLARSRSGLHAASERVRARWGSPCSLALGQLARIEDRAKAYPPDSIVTFESFQEPRP